MLVFDGVIMMEVTHQKTRQVAARLSGQRDRGLLHKNNRFWSLILGVITIGLLLP